MVPGTKGLEYGKRLEKLQLMTLERRNRSDLVELFKISRGLSAIPWDSFFRADSSERTKGHSKLAKKGFSLNIRKHFFHRVVNKWNGLSEEGASSGTVDT